MPKIVLASKNPAKVKATQEGFQRMFPQEVFEFASVSVTSGVKDQPSSDAEALQGALNRAEHASQAMPEADFWVGMEGGIEEKENEMMSFAWIVVKGKDSRIGKGRSGTFFLPREVVKLIKEGKELGVADDIVFQRKDSKQKNGAVGILTGDVLTRSEFYSDAVILALIPFKHQELY